MTFPFAFRRTPHALALGLNLILWASPAAAQQAPQVYVQAGLAQHAAHSQTVGAMLPWQAASGTWLGQQWQAYWDIYAARWQARTAAGERRSVAALGLTPSWRMLPGQGHARWFLDMGLGLVLNDRHYASGDKRQGTRYNFASHLGAGLWLDEARHHSLTLRLEHVSNASIKRPNPGEDFVQLRYAFQF